MEGKIMKPGRREAFINSYLRILTRSWSDPEFAERLEASPKDTVVENGLSVQAGASVVFVRLTGRGPDLDEQIAAWEAGAESGEYRLFVSDAPPTGTKELSEAELDSISGGAGPMFCCCQTGCVINPGDVHF